jgi:hypothetical protein
MTYYFKETDKGYLGKAFEMEIKNALNRRNANRVSPCGSADFRYHHKNYDTKQNGSVLQYHAGESYVKGSNRVIYATHIAHSITCSNGQIAVEVDLASTDMFVLDKKEFVNFLEEIGCVKVNAERGTVNIQTVYNYKKDAYHGKKGLVIEEWAYEHELDDDIIGEILAGL